jgi:23S rRNA (adenine1618-N6)-methyltransferase
MLNKALLKHHYDINEWDIPENYLCPPIPGRADYIHLMADLLASVNEGVIPTGTKVKCLDVGVGANCVYPLIGTKEYGWYFVGTDIDTIALDAAKKIIVANGLEDHIELRHQEDPDDIINGSFAEDEFFDLTLCNPPFHSSLSEAKEGSMRKISNLKKGKAAQPILNFGGQYNELWCKGGESRFIRFMIIQSKYFADSCLWFSTVVSKQSHLRDIYEELEHAGAKDVKTIAMGQGNKTSRIVAWTFLSNKERKKWSIDRWNTDQAKSMTASE